MASSVQTVARQVKPILSINDEQARRRVIQLYKTWYRQIPFIVREFDIPKSVKDCRQKLREEFVKHENIKDIRIIDMLTIKGQMELKETVNKWKNEGALMYLFKDTVEPKPTDFLSKFLTGHD
ncbi:NADH dehydrogenase [ubiquinone] 1 alpha subcomplex subunit 6 [Leptopilina heterotoma]|uniref:NADH dehydrogenase [ubiquinone] 1 alpha subcomplex subunit 6 n=1 Tax=Leptopilina heterotoma TaxID=63436 RepID=UPI001CA8508A|nr:NADH dehydrogenase [ubiquinone] 1 alpha subcomplex subunit 6 [Leptopilina heterotoma]